MNITSAKLVEISAFAKKSWAGENIEHYGEQIHWVEEKFLFKAIDNGHLVGYTLGEFEAGVIFLKELIIDKTERGKGIGKALIDYLASHSWKKCGKAHKIYLFTMESWKASKFYKKLGFRITAKFPKHYLKRDFVVFSKDI